MKAEMLAAENHNHRCFRCGNTFLCWNPYSDSENKCANEVTPICGPCLKKERDGLKVMNAALDLQFKFVAERNVILQAENEKLRKDLNEVVERHTHTTPRQLDD